MRRFYSLSAVLMLAIIALAACNSKDKSAGTSGGGAAVIKNGTTATPVSSTPNVPSDNVRRVTTVELRDMLDKGTAIVVDTRDAASYKANHIKSSINIPVNDVASRLGELPRDKMIVAYCSWPNEHTSARAVQIMKEKGIDNAAALLGGTNAWMNAGLPMESGEK